MILTISRAWSHRGQVRAALGTAAEHLQDAYDHQQICLATIKQYS